TPPTSGNTFGFVQSTALPNENRPTSGTPPCWRIGSSSVVRVLEWPTTATTPSATACRSQAVATFAWDCVLQNSISIGRPLTPPALLIAAAAASAPALASG